MHACDSDQWASTSPLASKSWPVTGPVVSRACWLCGALDRVSCKSTELERWIAQWIICRGWWLMFGRPDRWSMRHSGLFRGRLDTRRPSQSLITCHFPATISVFFLHLFIPLPPLSLNHWLRPCMIDASRDHRFDLSPCKRVPASYELWRTTVVFRPCSETIPYCWRQRALFLVPILFSTGD